MIRTSTLLTALLLLAGSALAQPGTDLEYSNDLQYYRAPGQQGLNVFEVPKDAGPDFDGLTVHVGGDFAIDFQGITQENDSMALAELAPNFALPTANLNLDVQIASGMRMHLRTYLSSRHHTESYVKGGYFQLDNLDFIQEDFLAEVMDVTRFRFGMDEINYGDAHFRRSDNAAVIYNPFVGNYIMDSFTTEPFAEVTVLKDGIVGVAGLTNGRLNQSPLSGDNGVAVYGKLGYDGQINEQVRARLTGSVYHSTDGSTRDYLYGGDRAGARYYNVLQVEGEAASDFLPRFNPRFPHQTAFQINPFVEVGGAEFFGVIEQVMGGPDGAGSFTQLGGELLYRFGADEDFYVGGRYNTVNGSMTDGGDELTINRFNVGGGWFLTPNVLAKVEYVNGTYDGDAYVGDALYEGAEYSGVVLEAAISF
ncbi:MAG TPA: hypothetical protein EYQ24_01050 [Bacteroidetes bacterium]|nr:hypothetical protein [Bacteroidota bacterium]